MAKRGPLVTKDYIKPPQHSRIIIYGLSLVTGRWKHLFDGEEYRTIVAVALNYCVYQHNLEIAGYLVTERRIFLILKIDEEKLNSTLRKFAEILETEIRKKRRPVSGAGLSIDETLYNGLFKPFILTNETLTNVLTGRHIGYPANSYAGRLKIWLTNYDFCSVNDYAGAEGPVKITKLPKDKFIVNYDGE